MQTNPNAEYDAAWHSDESSQPVENAVKAAASSDADRQAREFADAFNNDKFKVPSDDATDDSVKTAGLGDAIKNGAKALGSALMGKGTGHDATAEGQDYKRHVKEAESMGEKPMTQDEFHKSRQSAPAGTEKA